MKLPDRKFEDAPAVRKRVGLIVGVSGPTGSGKTYTAFRIATGIQRVVGGEIYGVDTERDATAMLHYAEYFKFRHVPLHPPHGPLDYFAAINHCVDRGAKVIVVDNMSHEHEGEGGVLDRIEQFLEKKCGDNFDCRNKNLMVATIRPKAERKALNRRITQLAGSVFFVLVYRSADKIKPRTGKDPEHLGWQPITTSDLFAEMTARYLLGPASEGVPTLQPEERMEKLAIRNPRMFANWLKPGEQITEELGERLARWALGDEAPAAAPAAAQTRPAASTAPRPTAAPRAASGDEIDPRQPILDRIAGARGKLKWDLTRAREFMVAMFGNADPAKLTAQQLEDAASLLDVRANEGDEAFEGELATLRELGRVRA